MDQFLENRKKTKLWNEWSFDEINQIYDRKKIKSIFEQYFFKIMSEAYQNKDIYDVLLIDEQNELLNILRLR